MNSIDVIVESIVIVVGLGIVAYIIYAPYLVIMNFLDAQRQQYVRHSKKDRKKTLKNNKHLILVFESIVSMLTKIAKSDGVVSELEADVIQDSITHFISMAREEGLNEYMLSSLREQLVQSHKKAKMVNVSISVYAQQLLNYDIYLKKQVIQQLIFMASIDGYTYLKESLIFNAGKALGFHHTQIERYIDDVFKFKQETPQDGNAYAVLGCKPTDDNIIIIKKRYRALVKMYHPDFIQIKEQNASSIKYSKQKIQEINNAYDIIKKERGVT